MADNEGARKNGKFMAICTTPDVCKTPVGNTVVPIPYPITATLNDSLSTSSNVNFGGDPAFVHNKSSISKVTGDEPGMAGGTKSGINKGRVKPIEGSSTVYVNKKPVVRHGDKCDMNNGNTQGKIIYQGVSKGGGSNGNSNPPVKPETPREETAKTEKKGLWCRMSDGVHTTLDVAGFIPGLGAIPDLANAAIYGLEGDAAMAALSIVAAVPGVGDGVKAGSMVYKGGKVLLKQAAKQTVKQTEKQVVKQVQKKVTKEALEKAERETAEKLIEQKAKKKATKKTTPKVAKKKGKDGFHVKGNKLPGPKLSQRTADTFADGKYLNRKLKSNETFYKYHGADNRTGKKVSWFTNKKYANEPELRKELAIRKDWGVKIDSVSKYDVPKGTWVSEGKAAAQGTGYPGGGYQAVIQNVPKAWIQTTKAFP